MKIILLADLEGVSGVVDNEQQAKPGAPLYQEAREYLLSDVNAVIEGALDGGATEITIFDMHYYGLNLNLSKIHPQTWVLWKTAEDLSSFKRSISKGRWFYDGRISCYGTNSGRFIDSHL